MSGDSVLVGTDVRRLKSQFGRRWLGNAEDRKPKAEGFQCWGNPFKHAL